MTYDEERQQILDMLLATIQQTKAGQHLLDLYFEDRRGGQFVIASFPIGTQRIDVTGDDGFTMIRDVVSELGLQRGRNKGRQRRP